MVGIISGCRVRRNFLKPCSAYLSPSSLLSKSTPMLRRALLILTSGFPSKFLVSSGFIQRPVDFGKVSLILSLAKRKKKTYFSPTPIDNGCFI
uniref:Uncharacterized protein n=1 Tax=Lotus japonicus TaxID=34305 RepID=I3S295_LOTJA|nr:unknown [Lotus japonicus]